MGEQKLQLTRVLQQARTRINLPAQAILMPPGNGFLDEAMFLEEEFMEVRFPEERFLVLAKGGTILVNLHSAKTNNNQPLQ